jgi:hypothetical protein
VILVYYFYITWESCLNTGVTFANFHSVGNVLVDNERLESLHRGYTSAFIYNQWIEEGFRWREKNKGGILQY